ncbi:MAG: SemiSWEET transporter [Candidatus Woesearchaeota archaeon]|jgi:MtN3 and saliva related transmembrane protein
MNWEIIGYVGGLLTTIAAIPQIIKAIKTKSLDDFAWGYLGVLTVGVLLWLFYGISKMDWVIISANIVTFILNGTLCIMKIVYRK